MWAGRKNLLDLVGLGEPSLQKRNRIASKIPRPHRRMWCSRCDANLVHRAQKCEVCGFVEGNSQFKKGEI